MRQVGRRSWLAIERGWARTMTGGDQGVLDEEPVRSGTMRHMSSVVVGSKVWCRRYWVWCDGFDERLWKPLFSLA
jgi:hypothetical protein